MTGTRKENLDLGSPVNLSTETIAAVAGANFRQLDYWARVGILVPVVPARGSGSRRRWGIEQAYQAAVIARLSALAGANCELSTFRPVVDAFTADATTGTFWVGDGVGFVVDFAAIRAEVAAALAARISSLAGSSA